MKTNEAPEKIYLIRNITRPTSLNCINDCRDKYLQEWYKGREKDTDIEYVRTDAFVEKAWNWFADRHQANGSYLCANDIEEFRKAMEE